MDAPSPSPVPAADGVVPEGVPARGVEASTPAASSSRGGEAGGRSVAAEASWAGFAMAQVTQAEGETIRSAAAEALEANCPQGRHVHEMRDMHEEAKREKTRDWR